MDQIKPVGVRTGSIKILQTKYAQLGDVKDEISEHNTVVVIDTTELMFNLLVGHCEKVIIM